MSTATLPAGVALLAASSVLCPARSGADGEIPLRPSTIRTLTSLAHSLRTEIPSETPLGDPHAPVHPFFRTAHVSSDVLAAVRSSWLSRIVEREETFAPSMYLLPVDDAREYEELLLHMDVKSCTGSFFLNRVDAICNVYEYLEKYFPKPSTFSGFGVVPAIILGAAWAEGPTTATVPNGRGRTQHRSPIDHRLVSRQTLEVVRSGLPLRFSVFVSTIVDCTMSLSESEFHGPNLACRIVNSAHGEVDALRSRARMALYRHNEHREPRGLKERMSLAIRTLDAECFSRSSTSVFPKLLQVVVKDDEMLSLLGLRLEVPSTDLSNPTLLSSLAPGGRGGSISGPGSISDAQRQRLALALFLVLESFPIVAFASRRHVSIAEDYLAHRAKLSRHDSTTTVASDPTSIFDEYGEAFATAVVKFAPLVFPLEMNISRGSAPHPSVSDAGNLSVPLQGVIAGHTQPATPPRQPMPLSPRRHTDSPSAKPSSIVPSGSPSSPPPPPLQRQATLPSSVLACAVQSPLRSPRRDAARSPLHTAERFVPSNQPPLPPPRTHSAPSQPSPSRTEDLSWWPGTATSSRAQAAPPSGGASVTEPPRSQCDLPRGGALPSTKGVFGLDDLRREFEMVMTAQSARRSPQRRRSPTRPLLGSVDRPPAMPHTERQPSPAAAREHHHTTLPPPSAVHGRSPPQQAAYPPQRVIVTAYSPQRHLDVSAAVTESVRLPPYGSAALPELCMDDGGQRADRQQSPLRPSAWSRTSPPSSSTAAHHPWRSPLKQCQHDARSNRAGRPLPSSASSRVIRLDPMAAASVHPSSSEPPPQPRYLTDNARTYGGPMSWNVGLPTTRSATEQQGFAGSAAYDGRPSFSVVLPAGGTHRAAEHQDQISRRQMPRDHHHAAVSRSSELAALEDVIRQERSRSRY